MELAAIMAGLGIVNSIIQGQSQQQAQREMSEEQLAQQQRLSNLGFAQNLMQQGQSTREKALDQLMNQFRSMIPSGNR